MLVTNFAYPNNAICRNVPCARTQVCVFGNQSSVVVSWMLCLHRLAFQSIWNLITVCVSLFFAQFVYFHSVTFLSIGYDTHDCNQTVRTDVSNIPHSNGGMMLLNNII